MKNLIISLILVTLFVCNLYPHGGETHQYIVREAFELLKLQKPEMYFSIMNDFVGSQEVGSKPFDKPYIVTGAIREDMEDIVYNYCNIHLGIPWKTETNCIDKTCTHFWDADYGDTFRWWYEGNYYENAFQKAKHYYDGTHTLFIYIGENNIFTEVWSLNSLIDLFVNGNYKLHGYYNIIGQYVEHDPPLQKQLNTYYRKHYAYNILGRICHLIGDMGVPAHCHNDDHCPIGFVCDDGTDTFEEFMKNSYQYQSIDYVDAYNQGGILFDVISKPDPLHYLLFIMNQYSDYYPSDSHDYNDDNYYHPVYSYLILDQIFSTLGPPPNSINCVDQKNNLFPFVIRATASFLYLIAYYTNDIPNIPVNQTTSGTLSNTEIWSGSFQLTGNVTVPQGKTLLIAKGANITIPANKKITVQGTLIAEGTNSEPITFDKSSSTKWWGIKFEDSSDDENCFLQYCTIQNASYGAYCYKSSPPIKNCNINHNTIGIYKAYGASQQDIFDKNFGYNSPGGVCFTNASDLNVRF
jgi:hypothetical protein